MNEKIQVLFDALKDEYDLGTIEDFTSYLQDDQKRSLFYEQVIAPNYEVSSIEEFENVYGLGGFDLKKKDGTSQEADTATLPQETISSAFVESNQVSPVAGAGFDESITTDQDPFRVEELMSPEDAEYFAEQDRLKKKNRARVKGDPIRTKQNLYRELTNQINANPRHNTDEFREEAFDLWNQMSEFKTAYRDEDNVDKWELGPTMADEYQGFEDFLEDMKNPVTEVQAYNLRMAGGDTSRGDALDIRDALNMTYKLDYARENLQYEKGEKEQKRQQLQKEEKKKEIGEAENLSSWLKLDQDALEDYLDTTPMPKEFEGEISRDEWKDRMRQKWSQHQEDVKSQTESLDKEDARFMDSYLASITPGLIAREEEEVVPRLNEEYGRYGFTFEETGAGDAMIVTSEKEGVDPIEIDLNVWTEEGEVLESIKLKKYLRDNAIHSEPIVEDEDRMFTEKAYRAQSLRDKGGLDNDGVSMTSGEYDGKNVAYPTLFPKDPNNYTEDPGDWMQLSGDDAYQEALKRGEVFYFDTPSEASNFAKGSWKYTDISDVEAEKFYESKGLDYQSMHVAYERYQELLDKEDTMANLLTRGGEIIEVDPTEGFKTKYRGIVTYEKDGDKEYARVRPDIQEHYNSVVSDREALFDDSFANEYAVKTREKWDEYAYEKQQEKAQSAANLNMMAKYINQELDKEALDIFNTSLDKVDVESLTPEELSIYNELNAIKQEADMTKKMAAQEYENANTYLNSRFNKEQVQTFLEGFEGIWAEIRSGWDRGEAAEQILSISLGMSDITDPKELSRIAATIVEEQRQAEKRGVSRSSALTASARNASEFWETVWDNPLDYMLGLAGNSMAQMAPYGWKIVPAAAGAGAATGAAYGALGANPYTVAGGGIVGAKWGAAVGMAATSYAMEYTNAVLDAGKNQGYDMMNPKDVELALQDQNVWSEGREIGMKRGIPIALVDVLGGGLAGKMIKVGSVASKGAKIGAQVAERAIVDPALEGLGEYLAQSVAGQDLKWMEIVAEMAGGMGSNSSTMAIEMLNQFRSKSNVELANNLTDVSFMAKEKSSDKSLSNWANRMHKLGKIDADMNQRIQENIGARREARSLLETEGVGRVLGAKKTKEEARVMQLLQARDELSSTTNRKEVFKAKIKAINEELAIMAETKAMAPENSMVDLALEEGKKDQPARYSIDGKLYTKKTFLEKVEAMSEGKRANKKIQVLNDPETAKQVGLKTIELDAVQEQQTEEGMLRPKAEEPTEQVGLQEVGQVQPEEVQEEALKGFDKKTVVQGKRTTHSYTDKSTGESVASVSFYEQSNGDIEVEGISVEKNYRRKGVAESIYNSLNKEASKKDGVLKSYGQFAQTGRAVPAKSLWNKLVDQGKAELVKEDKSLKTYPDASPNKEVSVYRMIPAKQQQQAKEAAPAEVATQEDVVVVDKGTKEDVKAFREGTIEDSRLESLLAGVAARKNEGKKLTKFQQEMFDANKERVEKLQVESKLLGEIFDVDETTKPTKVQPEEVQEEEIVYHGSPTKIQGGKLKKGSSEAIFLTPQKQYAQAYTGTQGQGEITETTITEDKKSKLFDLRNQEHVERLKQGFLKNNEDLEIEYDSEESALRDYENAIRSMNESAKDRDGVNDWASGGQWMDAMENAGFEGAIFSERPGVISYALFDKEIDVTKPSAQVKAEVAAKEDVVEEGKVQPQLETDEKEDVEEVAAEKERAMSEMEEAGVELAEDPFTVEQPAPEAEVTTITLDKDNPLTKDLERIGLKDLEGKKVNLVMADRLKVDEKNMGGPFFPLIKALRGKIAWASIDNEAASFIVKGAIDADYTVVYNMSSSGVDSNKVMGRQLIEKLDAISPQKKQEVFQLIKDHIKKLNNKNINKIKGLVAKSTSLDQLVDSIYNPKNDVDVRAAFTKAILPSQDVLEGSKSTPIANEMRELGVTIEGLRDEASEEFTRNIPTGSMTMVLEVTDKKGNKVTEKTKEEAIVGRDQQKKEGFPQHENYPVYIRGRVVGLLKETTPFWNVMPDYLKTINKKVAGLIKTIKKTKPLETLTPQELKVFEKLNAVFDAKNTKDKLEALSKVRLSKDLDKDIRETLRAQIIAAKKLRNKNDINEAVKQAITPFVKKGKISAKKARAEAIRSAEMSASVVRDVSSPKASTYQNFVSVLRRSFPSVEVVSTQKEFDELAKDIYAKKLTTKNQKVYGAVYKGKLYLNPGLANYNTPIHEFGHVWLNVAKEANKSLYNKGLSLIKESPYVKKVESSKSYKKIIDQMRKDGVSESDIEAYVLEEALAMAIGDRGEAFVVAAQKKNFKNWLSTLYGYVRKLTGISKYTSEQIETISLDEFLDAVNVDLLSGRKLFEGYQVSEMGDQLQLSMAKKPESTSMSAIIEEARTLNFSDAAIELYLRKKGYKVADIRSAMEIPLDMFTTMPPAFANVSNNSAVGQQLFSRVMEKANKFAKKKKDISQLRDKAKEILMEDPEFKELTKELQAELVIGLDKALAETNNRAIASDVKKMKAMIRERKAGAKGMANLRKEMKKFVLQNLPKTQWSTTRVKKILREISDARYYKDYYKLTTKPDNDIRLVLDNIVSEINKQNVEDILSRVEKQLSTKTTKLVGARVKGKLLPEAQNRIEKIKADMLAQDSSVESVTEKIDKLREEREQLMNANEITDEQVKRIFDIDMAILYNESILLENTDSYKADTLKDVYNRLKSTFKEERNEYVEAIKAAKERYNAEKSQIFEEVSGVKIDYSSEESVEEATRKIEQKENRNRNRSKAVKVLKSFLESFDWIILRTEAIEGLIDRIQKMPGEIFGGKAVELISDRFDKSRNMYIEGMNFLKATTETKAKEIFGKDYIRKMKRNNIKSVKIYTDPKRVNELTEQLKDKSLTKKERRKISNEINSLTMLMSQNEMYYLYNQAKDPSLMPGLENKPGWGKSTEDILAEIESKLDPEVRRWADWQVEEFFPSVYERYNAVYKEIYRTNMPWNEFYAGIVSREGVEQTMGLLDMGANNYQTMVGARSTKARMNNSNPILTMDGDSMLASYISEMEYFRAYGETVRDVTKIIKDPKIRRAIEVTSGKDVYNILNKQYDKIIDRGKSRAGSGSKIFNWMTRSFVVTKLGLNPTIALKQFTSALAFADYIGYRNWTKEAAKGMANNLKTFKSSWTELYENSVYLQDRYNKGDFARLLEDYNTSKKERLYSGVTTIAGKEISVDKAMDLMMFLVKFGDKAGVMGSIPNYNYYKSQFKKNNPKATEQQAIDHAVKKVEKQIDTTQQSSAGIQARDYFQTDNFFYRWMSLFTSSSRALLRKDIMAVRNLYRKLVAWDKSAGRGTLGQNIRTFVTYHVVLPMFFQYVALGLPGILRDWREEDDEELGMAAALGTFNSLFILGDILAGARDLYLDKPWAASFRNLPVFDQFGDLYENIQKMDKAKKDETKEKYFNRAMLNILEMGGVPANQVLKIKDNWSKLLNEDMDFGEAVARVFNYSDYTIEGKPQKKEKKEKKKKKKKKKKVIS